MKPSGVIHVTPAGLASCLALGGSGWCGPLLFTSGRLRRRTVVALGFFLFFFFYIDPHPYLPFSFFPRDSEHGRPAEELDRGGPDQTESCVKDKTGIAMTWIGLVVVVATNHACMHDPFWPKGRHPFTGVSPSLLVKRTCMLRNCVPGMARRSGGFDFPLKNRKSLEK